MKYPRIRGEHSQLRLFQDPRLGSPPLTRGTREPALFAIKGSRITPAYAGNTFLIHRQVFHSRDHPRLRGEHLNINFATFFILGSPPLTRGTQCCLCWILQIARITPAYAGNTGLVISPNFISGDHPRLRGEHFFRQLTIKRKLGSPPLTRGTQQR